jgi:hypothetical protein
MPDISVTKCYNFIIIEQIWCLYLDFRNIKYYIREPKAKKTCTDYYTQ